MLRVPTYGTSAAEAQRQQTGLALKPETWLPFGIHKPSSLQSKAFIANGSGS